MWQIRDWAYQYDMWVALTSNESANMPLDDPSRPSLDTMIQILTFFQAYRTLEKTLFILDPSSKEPPSFGCDITPHAKS